MAAGSDDAGNKGREHMLRVEPIHSGTVIDHITAGQALNVLRVLKIDSNCSSVVSVLMNVGSKKMGRKDIVKVEDRELSTREAQLIGLLAPSATINIIRRDSVTSKFAVDLPEEVGGVLKCPNPNCITNSGEPLSSLFRLISKEPVALVCHYCGAELRGAIFDHLI